MFEWDDNKAAPNLAKHRVSFERVREFEWGTAKFVNDGREDYGEVRINAIGFIGVRLHAVTYTPRGETYRIISLRKANKREQQAYSQA